MIAVTKVGIGTESKQTDKTEHLLRDFDSLSLLLSVLLRVRNYPSHTHSSSATTETKERRRREERETYDQT